MLNKSNCMNVRLFAKGGLLKVLPLMAKATNKTEEAVIEDLVMNTEPFYLASCDSSIERMNEKVGGRYNETYVGVTDKTYKFLKFFCEKWRMRLDQLIVVCLYYSHLTPRYMTEVHKSLAVAK